MIHDEIVTFEVAKLAKENGFPQNPNKNNHCDMYCWDGLRNIHSLGVWAVWYMEEYDHDNLYAAPTQSLLQKWLREGKNIDIVVMPIKPNDYAYFLCGSIHEEDGAMLDRAPQPTYELALEDALKYELENLI